MHRTREILLLLWGMSGAASAQFAPLPTYSLEIADQHYQAKRYAQAALFYRAAVARDTSDWQSTFQLAETLRHQFQYSEALPHYQRVFNHASQTYPEAEFYYALMLQQAQRCSEALPLFNHFVATYPNLPLVAQARVAQQGCYQNLLSPEPSALSLERLPALINSAAHDYAAVPYRHDSSLVLTSGRWQTPHRRLDARYGENYTNLFLLEQEADIHDRSRKIARWNSAGHDGPGCFDAQRTKFYFTRCQKGYCQIYVSDLRQGTWQLPRALQAAVNAPNTNSKHPALSPRGDTLFFASDRPGGSGGLDLWMSVCDSTKNWRAAQNLGESVNTSGDEVAPAYLSAEGLFVYASSGRGGLGGMDLYGVPGWKHGARVPQPLLVPFNSEQDDCFLTLGYRRGYLSSNRTGDFDIYQFVPDTTRSLTAQLLGNDGRLPYALEQPPKAWTNDALLEYDLPLAAPIDDIVIVRSVPEERLSNGSSRFMLASDVSEIALSRLKNQSNNANSPSFSESASPFATVVGSAPLTVVSTDRISPTQRAEMTGTLLQELSGRLTTVARSSVHLLDSTGAVAKSTTTNEAGEFHFVNLTPATRYALVVGRSLQVPDSTLRLQNLRLGEYGEATITAPYETLYFDFNQSALRPEAKQALQELVQLFVLHPTTAIEVNAFTDSLGNDAYNLQLSQQRGAAVVDFLVAQGVAPSALVLNAEGVSTAWSSTNSGVSQQLNRRVEIRLVGKGFRYAPQAETRILRPNATVEKLISIKGIDAKQLEQLNGYPVDTLPPLAPLRIPRLRNPALRQFFFDINQQN